MTRIIKKPKARRPGDQSNSRPVNLSSRDLVAYAAALKVLG